MNSCTKCPFCPEIAAADFTAATDVRRVSGIVRAFAKSEFTVWRCSGCGSLHAKEAADLPHFYEGYPFAKHQLDFWTVAAYKKRTKQLTKQGVKKSDAILDFGCGAGVFVSYLSSQGYADVVGYDAFVPKFAAGGSLERRYDAVLAQDVLEHADDPAVMLKQLIACLKPNGLLYLGTPLADGIRLREAEAFAMSLHQPYHRHILSLTALRQLTRAHGLTATGLSKRHCTDTVLPLVNTRFLHEFIKTQGNVVDAGFEPPPKDLFKRHPKLLLYAFLGYFFSRRCEMSAFFRTSAEAAT